MLLKSYAIIASSLLTLSSASVAPQRQTKKSVKLDFDVLRGDSSSDASRNTQAKLSKRDDGQESLDLTNMQSYYQVTLNVGSEGAKCQLLIDTGSSDLWVMSSDVKCSSSSSVGSSRRRLITSDDLLAIKNGHADDTQNKKRETITLTYGDIPTDLASLIGGIPTEYASELAGTNTAAAATGLGSCTGMGSFNTAESDSFRLNSSAPNFAITYADGTYARGFWGQDSIDMKDFNVSDMSLAVVNDTTSSFGVLGIGLEGLEVTYASSRSASLSYTYENFPSRLKSSGAINKVLYSLYLAESNADKGSILFGAVDHAKYTGQLQTVPLVNIYSSSFDRPIRLDIALDSISLQSSTQNVSVSDSKIAALLDSGTTLSYLPTAILNALTQSLRATFSKAEGFYKVSCDYNTNSAFVVFNFSGAEIKVPLSDLILSYGSRQCFLGVLEQSSDASVDYPYAILGDNFIRNAYIVYDLEDYEISLAQANYSSDEDIEVVSDSVPRASKAAGYSSTSLDSDATGLSLTDSSLAGLRISSAKQTASFSRMLALASLGLIAIIAII